jgi:hypothetical protein
MVYYFRDCWYKIQYPYYLKNFAIFVTGRGVPKSIFSHIFFVSLKSPYSVDMSFGGLDRSLVFGHKNNMEDYFNQILHMITNVNRLQENQRTSLCSRNYIVT